MKKQYISFLMIIIGICSAASFEQQEELIVLPKNKKKYISEQQYIELAGELIVVTNDNIEVSPMLLSSTACLQQLIALIQKKCLTVLNDYVDGQKDCFLKQANKMQRTDCYEKLLKCKHKVEVYTQKMKKMQQHIESMHKELQQQFQDVLNIELNKIQSE
jgi:hypothetical protein